MKKTIRTAGALLLCLLLLLSACAVFAEGQPSLSLDQAELTLAKGKTQKLKATLENAENPKKAKYAWESSDPAVATVDKSGQVKAKDGGTAEITCTATLENGTVLTAAARVTVTVPVQALKIRTKAGTPVSYGGSLQLEYTLQPENATDQTVTWTSANEDILRVDENGVVTAVSAGKANITGTASGGKSAKVSLYVPTLAASSDAFTVTAKDSVYHFTYCGNDFDKNVQITAKGNCFNYTIVRNDPDIGLSFVPLSPGQGTVTVSDKKDSAAKFTVTVTVSDDAFPAGRRLLVTDAGYDPGSGKLTVTWTNTGSRTVAGAELRIEPLDAEGNALAVGEGYIEDLMLEERVYHATAVVEPGKSFTASFGVGGAYPDAADFNLAFDRMTWTVTGKDGTVQESAVTELPDDRLCWYSVSHKAYVSGPENSEPYTPPGEEVFSLAARARLGITTLPVTAELAEAYGFACGGLLVVSVEEGSPADTVGLEPGDLVFSANGLLYGEDPYFLARAAAELAEGKPATLLLERDNEFYELSLTPEEDG